MILPSAPVVVQSGGHLASHEIWQTTCVARTEEQALLRITDDLADNIMAGAVRRHLVKAMNKALRGRHTSWERDIAEFEPGGGP